jgi:multiple sugar transport system ATP-binding protein
MSVELRGVSRTYPGRRGRDSVRALDALDLDLEDGQLVVVVGPSGSGKSTLLRSIAGLEPIDAGTVRIGGRDVTGLPAGDRKVAMVFQDSALYPHLDVEANISFGLRARGSPRTEAAARVREAAAQLSIETLLRRRPGELSGGERQRVALARAIVREPAVFLLDEPLASLDAELRAQAREEIRSVQRRLGTAMAYVTHDHVEAMSLGDRVAVLRAGKVVQVDAPTTVYDRPASPFVARMFGSPPMNVLPADLVGAAASTGVDSGLVVLLCN